MNNWCMDEARGFPGLILEILAAIPFRKHSHFSYENISHTPLQAAFEIVLSKVVCDVLWRTYCWDGDKEWGKKEHVHQPMPVHSYSCFIASSSPSGSLKIQFFIFICFCRQLNAQLLVILISQHLMDAITPSLGFASTFW